MKYKKAVFYTVIVLMVIGLSMFFITYRAKILRILSPFLMAIPLTYIVKPVTDKLAKRKIPVSISVLLIYFAFLAAIAAAGVFFVPELALNIRELMETLPQLLDRYEEIFNRLLSYIKSSNWSEQVKEAIFGEIKNSTEMVREFLVKSLENGLDIIVDIARIIVDLTVAMVITYYIAKDGKKFGNQALLFLPHSWRAGVMSTGKEINKILAGFIQGQLITALIVGVLETIGLMIIKMKYPLVLGMIGGLANIIPYFGPFIGAIPAAAIALTISPIKFVWVVVVFAAIQQIENNFISPKMIESKLGMHPVATIFAVLIGGEFFGIKGMLFAVPVMAIIRVLINKAIEAIV